MESWEDFDDDEPVAVAQGAFEDDGFGDGDLKESWDDDDEADTNDGVKANGSAPAKKKRTVQQAIKEREALEAAKAAELAAKKADQQQQQEPLETEFERKARLAQTVRDADFQNALALLGGTKF
jgi:hypothetical protein